MDDEAKIRKLVADWLAASKAGDTEAVLNLMADDVVFMVVGREPFGKQEFAAISKGPAPKLLESRHEIKELQVVGSSAWMRSHLEITTRQPDGKTASRAGHILTILKKKSDGSWVIARDANMLTQK